MEWYLQIKLGVLAWGILEVVDDNFLRGLKITRVTSIKCDNIFSTTTFFYPIKFCPTPLMLSNTLFLIIFLGTVHVPFRIVCHDVPGLPK